MGNDTMAVANEGDFPPTVLRQIDGYTVRQLDDGCDYWAIVREFEAGRIPHEKQFGKEYYGGYIINADGRRMVLKYDARPLRYWECKLSRFVRGPAFARAMKLSNRAVRDGCDVVQKVFMVAEKMRNGLAERSVILLEYFPGHTLWEEPDPSLFHDQLKALLLTLHRYRLAQIDPNARNFIVTPERTLKVIDLSFRDGFLMARAKETARLAHSLQIETPSPSLLNRILTLGIRANRYLRNLVRILRKHPKAKRSA